MKLFDTQDMMLAAYVARATELEPCVIGALLYNLKRISRRHHNAAVRLCNEAAFANGKGPAIIARIEAEGAEDAGQLGLPMTFERDPRGGCSCRFRLPDGRSNNMGGEDWSF